MRTARKRQRSPRKTPFRIRPSLRGRVVSATEAARSFSSLLDRVAYRGEAFVIERGGEAACEIRPAGPPRFLLSDLAALVASGPKPDSGFWKDVERATRDPAPVAPSPWDR